MPSYRLASPKHLVLCGVFVFLLIVSVITIIFLPPRQDDPGDLGTVTIGGEKYPLRDTDHEVHQLRTAWTGKPMPVQVMGNNARDTLSLSTSKDPLVLATPHSVQLKKMGESFTISVNHQGRTYTHIFSSQPPSSARVTFSGTTTLDRDKTYLTSINSARQDNSNNYLAEYNPQGEMVYYRTSDRFAFSQFDKWHTSHSSGVSTSGYSYLQKINDDDAAHREGKGGEFIITGANHSTTDRVHMMDTGKHPDAKQQAYIRDIQVIGAKNYVVMGYLPKKDDSGHTVLYPYIQEHKKNKVVKEWYGADYHYFTDKADEAQQRTQENGDNSAPLDVFGTESMFIDPHDGNIVLSNRKLNNVTKINKATGDIMWILGGSDDQFHLTDAQRFAHQHHVYMDQGQLRLYDTPSVRNKKSQSDRSMVFSLDEENKKVTNVQVLPNKKSASETNGLARASSGEMLIAAKNGSVSSLYDSAGKPVKTITIRGRGIYHDPVVVK